MSRILLLAAFSLTALPLFLSCTKSKNSESQATVYSKNYSDPNKLIAEITLKLSDKAKKSVKKSDFLIWSLQDKSGQILSGSMTPVISFPYKITVTSKQLFTSIVAGSPMLFTARLVQKGDEYAPPKKGQLSAVYGILDDGVDAKNSPQVIDEAKLKKLEQKLKIEIPQKFIVGDKVTSELH